MARGSLSREITLEELRTGARHVPEVTADDIAQALCRARVQIAVEEVCERRNDLHNEAEAREAFRFHVEQCFRKYFLDALHRIHAGQIQPSVFVRHLRRLASPRSRKTDSDSEITGLVLKRESERQPNKDRTALLKSASAYERRKALKAAAGRGGRRHEGNQELRNLYGDLMDAYREFTGRNPSAHSRAGEYDGPFIRFMLCLFQSNGAKAEACGNALIAQVGETLRRQTANSVRDRWRRRGLSA